jgi:hypothetical protein
MLEAEYGNVCSALKKQARSWLAELYICGVSALFRV